MLKTLVLFIRLTPNLLLRLAFKTPISVLNFTQNSVCICKIQQFLSRAQKEEKEREKTKKFKNFLLVIIFRTPPAWNNVPWNHLRSKRKFLVKYFIHLDWLWYIQMYHGLDAILTYIIKCRWYSIEEASIQYKHRDWKQK